MNATISMLIAALSFSFCPLLYALSLTGASAMTQALYVQIAVTVVASIGLVGLRRNMSAFIAPTKELFKLPWETWTVIILSGVAGYMGTLFFLWSLKYMSEAGAAIIMESWPILAVFIAPVLMRNHTNRIRLVDVFIIGLIIFGALMINGSDANMSVGQFIDNPFFMFQDRSFENYIGIFCAFMSAFCYAWAGSSRPYFSALLPFEYRKKHFSKGAPFFETLYSFWLTCLSAMPIAIVVNIFMDESLLISQSNIIISLSLGICLTIMGCMYAYSLMVSNTSMINLLWYIAPILATLWLVIFGYSQITPLFILGGGLIIGANLLLVLSSKKKTTDE
jgi:drug/metabolite transporter (DMT)-like permease